MVKQISILGSTGSVGRQTLDVIKDFPDKFRVLALTGNKNVDLLAQQVKSFQPELAVLDPEAARAFPAPGGTEGQGVGRGGGAAGCGNLSGNGSTGNGGGGFCRFKTYPGVH